MNDCNWCGIRNDPPKFCNKDCEREYNEASEKYFKFLEFLIDHIREDDDDED